MKTLGTRLRKAREIKGLSIQEVHSATKIRVVYLVAMEEDRFHELPGDVYVRGFLRSFANAVGLEGDELVSEYNREYGCLSKPSKINQIRVDDGKTTKIQRRPKVVRVIHLAVIVLVTIMFLMSTLFLWKPKDTFEANKRIDIFALKDDFEDGTIQETIQEMTDGNNEQPPDNEHLLEDSPASYEIIEVAEFKDDHELIIAVNERCWVRVIADGHRVFERTMLPGEAETWNADREIRIKLGNAGGADLTHNGIRMGPLGKSGDVIELVFPDHGT